MSQKTIATSRYYFPLNIKWKCTKCNNEVFSVCDVNVIGDSSTRSRSKKAKNDASNRAMEIAEIKKISWLKNIANAPKTRKYYGTNINCVCPNCGNRENWSTRFEKLASVIMKIVYFSFLLVIVGIYCFYCGDILEGILFTLPFIISFLLVIILDRIDKNFQNKKTKVLPISALPEVSYDGHIISTPKMEDMIISIESDGYGTDENMLFNDIEAQIFNNFDETVEFIYRYKKSNEKKYGKTVYESVRGQKELNKLLKENYKLFHIVHTRHESPNNKLLETLYGCEIVSRLIELDNNYGKFIRLSVFNKHIKKDNILFFDEENISIKIESDIDIDNIYDEYSKKHLLYGVLSGTEIDRYVMKNTFVSVSGNNIEKIIKEIMH